MVGSALKYRESTRPDLGSLEAALSTFKIQKLGLVREDPKIDQYLGGHSQKVLDLREFYIVDRFLRFTEGGRVLLPGGGA